MRDAVVREETPKAEGVIILADAQVPITATLDSGAELNVIDPKLAIQLRLATADVALPKAPAWGDGKTAFCYGAYLVPWEAVDSRGTRRRCVHVAYALEHAGTPFILGMPGLASQDILLDTAKKDWWYRESPVALNLLSAGELDNALKNCPYVLVVHETGPENQRGNEGAAIANTTLPAEFAEFADVFDEAAAVTQPPHEQAEHAIETTADPPFRRIYPHSARELEELRRYIVEAKANGWIRDSTSPAGAPILFVPKSDGSLRLCVDYRGLNEVTVKNRHPLPLISEIIDRLSGSAIFTKLDLKWAYHRIRIKRGDEWKTAFRTRYGHYEYLVMPFGLANAPATFQSYINKALGELVDHICIVYLDDIIIYSRSRDAHVAHVKSILKRLRQYGLFCNPKKCEFFQTRVEFLGYVVSTEGVSMDPRKVDAIATWPQPTTFPELQTFLGFCNFYRRFIEAYSRVVAPLTGMLKGSVSGRKSGPFEWSKDAETAFRKLLERFTSAPLLIYFEPSRRTRIETDASAYAIAAIISQLLAETGQWHPVAYFSRKMIDAEKNYEVHDQELLAIVESFKHWRQYLDGSRFAVEVITDHRNLVGFTKVKQLNGRQARWAMLLSAFDFTITHRAGKLNPADTPSRRPDYNLDKIKRTTNKILPTLFTKLVIKPKRALNRALLAGLEESRQLPATCTIQQRSLLLPVIDRAESVAREGEGEEPALLRSRAAEALEGITAYDAATTAIRNLICESQKSSSEAQSLRGRLSKGDLNKHWSDHDGVLKYEGRLYVPPVRAVREELLKRYHDDPYAGHFGTLRTTELLKRRYHWPGMGDDVAAYVKSCDICQKVKVKRHKPYGKMQPLPKPTRPWEEIAIDFMSGVPLSMRGEVVYDAILVIVDRYSKMALYFPVTKTVKAADIADILIDSVFTRFGFPNGIVSDRDPRFTSDFWSELCYYAKVKRRLSTAFHPQTDGQTERQNQTLQEYLRAFCSLTQREWASRLPIAEFAFNNAFRTDLGATPFRVVLGYDPPSYFDAEDSVDKGRVPAAKERIQRIHELREDLQERLEHASEAQAKYYNQKHQPITFKKDQLVLISTKNLRLQGPSKKMAPRMMGPFRIHEPVGSQAYRVHLPTDSRIHNVFHVSAMEPYHSRNGEQEVLPIPELADDEEQYEVEEVLGSTRKRGEVWYMVKWKGWPEEYNQWVLKEDLNADELVREWEAKKSRRRGTRSKQ